MSRAIKFRIWDNYKKQFIKHPCWVNHLDSNDFCCFDRFFKMDEEGGVLQQYTGFKDENGQEIYEGDIVEGPMEIVNGNFRTKSITIEWNQMSGFNFNRFMFHTDKCCY